MSYNGLRHLRTPGVYSNYSIIPRFPVPAESYAERKQAHMLELRAVSEANGAANARVRRRRPQHINHHIKSLMVALKGVYVNAIILNQPNWSSL